MYSFIERKRGRHSIESCKGDGPLLRGSGVRHQNVPGDVEEAVWECMHGIFPSVEQVLPSGFRSYFSFSRLPCTVLLLILASQSYTRLYCLSLFIRNKVVVPGGPECYRLVLCHGVRGELKISFFHTLHIAHIYEVPIFPQEHAGYIRHTGSAAGHEVRT